LETKRSTSAYSKERTATSPTRTTCGPTRRIAGIRWATPRVGIRLRGLGQQGVHGEKLLGGGVVGAGAQVLQARLGVGVLAGIAAGGEGAGLGQHHAVGIIGRRATNAARAVGQGADAAQLVGVGSVDQVLYLLHCRQLLSCSRLEL